MRTPTKAPESGQSLHQSTLEAKPAPQTEAAPDALPPARAEGASIAAFWSIGAAELMARLESGPLGLTQAEASARLKRYGANSVKDQR